MLKKLASFKEVGYALTNSSISPANQKGTGLKVTVRKRRQPKPLQNE